MNTLKSIGGKFLGMSKTVFFFFFFLRATRCPNLAVKEAEDDENIEEDDALVEKTKKVSHAKRKKQTECNLMWVGEPVLVKSP